MVKSRAIPATNLLLQFMLRAMKEGTARTNPMPYGQAVALRRQLYRLRKSLQDTPDLSTDYAMLTEMSFTIDFGEAPTRVGGNHQTIPLDKNAPSVIVADFAQHDLLTILNLDADKPVLSDAGSDIDALLDKWEAEKKEKQYNLGLLDSKITLCYNRRNREVKLMKRHDDLLKVWKCTFPATLAGKVEIMLWDGVNQRPIYGARAILLESLLEWWIAREEGRPLTPVPSIHDLRARALGFATMESLENAISQP